MSLGRIRPRFTVRVPGTVDEEIALLQAAVGTSGSRCVSRVLGNHVDITIVREERHRWSPCVHLELLESAEGTIVHGMIAPHPNVWTLFAFVYITIATATAFGLMLGLTQLFLEQYAWGLWTVPAGLLLSAGMYGVSQVGQRLAADQTRLLSELIDDALRGS
ncbi:MAG: hypothetical protein GY715_05705 [Planctomycetes bacterium]|nr:hypothetical protein [Planctomycetota bacterium]